MRLRTCCLAALLGAALFAPATQAALITVTNASFETPDVTGATAGFTITGWGQGADTGITNDGPNGGPGTPPTAADGSQFAFLGNGTNFTNIYQDISNAGQADATSYVLTVAFAKRAGFGETPGTNGSINLGIQDLTGTGATQTTAISRAALTNTFADFSVTLPSTTVAAGDSIRIFIDKLAGNSLIVVDNVRLEAVPEPASLSAGLAALGLLGRRRRR